MTNIDPNEIRRLIAPNGTLLVPDSITSAIKKCVEQITPEIEAGHQQLEETYKRAMQQLEPISYDYDGAATIDAYTQYYLPRYTLVPKIAMLYLAHCPAFQKLPDRLRVLDLGSGTGAVVLGLVDLFKNRVLLSTSLNIRAVDSSIESLQRQGRLLQSIGLPLHTSWTPYQAHLSVPGKYEHVLQAGAPYDLIFCANILTELPEDAIDALLQHAATLLSDNGVIVIAEAQRDYIKKQMVRIAKMSSDLGLYIYYPCPPDLRCPKSPGDCYSNWCWMWREDSFTCPGGNGSMTKPLLASWMILCKQRHSIYEMFPNCDSRFVWSVAAPHKKKAGAINDKWEQPYELCVPRMEVPCHKLISAPRTRVLHNGREIIRRGSIIGFRDDFSNIMNWDILNVNGFLSCDDIDLQAN